MKHTEEQLNDFINVTIEEWSIYALSVLAESLRRKKLIASEELLQSLKSEIVKSAAGLLAKSILSFDDYGRFKDIRVITHKNAPPPASIEKEFIDWVKGMGIGKFKYVPGYKSGKIPTDSRALKRIAWGVAFGLKKRGKTVGKAWYAKRMAGAIHNLTERLVTNSAEIIAKSMASQISGKTV